MLLANPITGLGDLSGTIYEFQKSGDELPGHAHTEENSHITIVTRGKIIAIGDSWDMQGTPGTILDFKPNIYHRIVALEDDTRIVNILKKANAVYSQTPE